MSLFGGDGAVSQPPSPRDRASPASLARSPPPVPTSPRSAQTAQTEASTSRPFLESDEETDEETESDLDPDADASRPNRFVGPRRNWERYTEEDRQIAASLEQLREGDLAAHLYNAHMLKLRARKSNAESTELNNWSSKDTWLRSGEQLKYTDLSGQPQTHLIPYKEWTAWPLPEEELPEADRLWGSRGWEREEDAVLFGRVDDEDPGQYLREQLLATFLKLAREKWDNRPSEPETDKAKSVKSERNQRSGSEMSQQPSDTEIEDAEDEDTTSADASGYISTQSTYKHPNNAHNKQTFRPTVLADEDKARRLLQPTINSLLSKMDDVVLAIRRSRQNHFGKDGYSDTSTSDLTTDADSHDSESETSSRATSKKSTIDRVHTLHPKSKGADLTESNRNPKRRDQSSVESDYDSEYGSASASDREPVRKKRRGRYRSSRDLRSSSELLAGAKQNASGLMDWSEVLGIAAMTGWNSDTLSRTAQRCSTLFGEVMSFRTMDESLASKPITEPVQYLPGTISTPLIDPPKRPKRPIFEPGTLRCPHEDCWGHYKEFERGARLVEHLRRIHTYHPAYNNSDTEDRKVGGVHIDGFLRPITAKHGWLGRGIEKTTRATTRGKGKSKKTKFKHEASEEEPA